MHRVLRSIQQTQFDRRSSNTWGFRWLLVALGCTFASGIVVTFNHGETVTPTVDKTIPDQRFRPKKQAFFPAPQNPDESATETTSRNEHASTATTQPPPSTPSTPETPSPSTSEPTTDGPPPSEEASSAPPPPPDSDRNTRPVPGVETEPESETQPSNDLARSPGPADGPPVQPASKPPSEPSPTPPSPGGTGQSGRSTVESTEASNDQLATTDKPSSGSTNQGSNQKVQDGGTGVGQGSTAGPGLPPSTTTEPVRYDTCDDAYDAGVAPILVGEPGYERRLDADNDGIACDIDLRV